MIRAFSVAVLTLVATGSLSSPDTSGSPLGMEVARTSVQAQDSAAAAADTTLSLTNDGPHIYWRSETEAVVFYACEGELFPKTAAPDRGIISFYGFCGDSLTLYRVRSRPPEAEPFDLDGVSRIFTVSDIHGEYDALIDLLVNAGVVDQDLRWSWGDGHLVVLGDVFDRGDKVTECLWLIHRLEREARDQRGRVHYLLGNHELMVMQGDLRYVNPKYIRGPIVTSGIEYQDLFGPEMEFGRWLRSKHTAIKLNDILFVHAGLGMAVVDRDLSLREINAQASDGVDLRSYALVFDDMPGFLYRNAGPLWYRGYHRDLEGWYDRATVEEVEAVLDHFGADAVVVGHTDIGEVQALYGGLVFGVDVSLEKVGSLQGLLWEDGSFYRVTGEGEKQPLAGS